MQNNKKIITFVHITGAFVLWFLTRSALHFLHSTYYPIRRLPYIDLAFEVLPAILGVGLFIYLFRNEKVNQTLVEVVAELKKVTWPSRPDVVKSTTVVIICVIFASLVFAGIDLFWGKILGFFLHS